MAKLLANLAPNDVFEVGVNYVSLIRTKRYMNALNRPTRAGKVSFLFESKQNVHKREPLPNAAVNLTGLPIYDYSANFTMQPGNSFALQTEYEMYDQDYVSQDDPFNVFSAHMLGLDRSFEFTVYNHNASLFAISALEVTGDKLPPNSISGV